MLQDDNNMEYKNLGESGLKVSKIVVGCMSFGSKKWQDWLVEDEDTIFRVLKKCYDNGLRTFDTADVYSNGISETLLGKFLKKYDIPRERVVILTKVNFPVDIEGQGRNLHKVEDWVNAKGLSRKHIFDGVKASTERLGTYIDVLQIHQFDPNTPKKETMKALNDVVQEGYARYIGALGMKAVYFAELQFIADKYGWFKFISMQSYYSLLYREDERELIPFCVGNDFGKVGLIPWGPNACGLLTRPLGAKSDLTNRASSQHFRDVNGKDEEEIIKRVEEVANRRGVSMATIATAWVILKGCFPNVGINSESRVDDAIKALLIELTPAEIKYLEEPYIPKYMEHYYKR